MRPKPINLLNLRRAEIEQLATDDARAKHFGHGPVPDFTCPVDEPDGYKASQALAWYAEAYELASDLCKALAEMDLDLLDFGEQHEDE